MIKNTSQKTLKKIPIIAKLNYVVFDDWTIGFYDGKNLLRHFETYEDVRVANYDAFIKGYKRYLGKKDEDDWIVAHIQNQRMFVAALRELKGYLNG